MRSSEYYYRKKNGLISKSEQRAKMNADFLRDKNPEHVIVPRIKSLNTRISVALRIRLYTALRRYENGGKQRAIKYLGCSLEELKQHLERQFTEGMNWDNWSFNGWHIDHIRPLNTFDLRNEEHLAIACHYSNLQPLWATDNLRKSKGAKFIAS